jgi:hypothetical protein
MLSSEMQHFYEEWLGKADSYPGDSLHDYYNKAFSLFAVYNRLYCEATFTLARARTVTLSGGKPFPDSRGAKEYGPQFVGFEALLKELEDDAACNAAIESLKTLIEEKRFNIKLSMPFGKPQQKKIRNC